MPAKTKRLQPTELELLILKVLWQASDDDLPMAVRDVRDRLAQLGRDLAHTSVITTLNIMVEKKFLNRRKRKNAFLFSPIIRQDAVQSRAIGDVINRLFDGSVPNLMLALLDRSDVDADDLAEIRRMINRKTKQKSE